MDAIHNKEKETIVSAEQMTIMMASKILVQTALALLQDAGISTEVLTPYVGEELIMANRYAQRREHEASRKRVSRVVKRLLTAKPEEVAKIKAERYPNLSATEIERVEQKVQEKLQEEGEVF